EWRTATPWPDRTACLRRDDGLGWCAKSPAAMPAWDNLRFGLSPIDSDIFARGNPDATSKLRELNSPAVVVAAIHPEAMPVFLTTPWEIEVWPNAETALELQ